MLLGGGNSSNREEEEEEVILGVVPCSSHGSSSRELPLTSGSCYNRVFFLTLAVPMLISVITPQGVVKAELGYHGI